MVFNGLLITFGIRNIIQWAYLLIRTPVKKLQPIVSSILGHVYSIQYRSASLSINPAFRARTCTDCEYIECTIAIIIIVSIISIIIISTIIIFSGYNVFFWLVLLTLALLIN